MPQTLPTAANQAVAYEDFYESTLAQDVGTSDTQIFPSTLPMSTSGFLVMDPDGDTPECIFYNALGANYVTIPSAVNGEGRGVFNTSPGEYDQGTKIGMYSVAAFFEMLATGRGIRDGAIESRHFAAGLDPNQWVGTGETWNYGGTNGQKESYYVIAGDKTSKYSKGMKVRLPRVSAPGTQCADLEFSSSQYASRSASITGVAFTDDYSTEAWVKPESYSSGSNAAIISRFNGSTGWIMHMNPSGQITMFGQGAAVRDALSTQSVPLGQWTHIAATMDMSAGVSAIYFNGVSVPVTVTNAGTSLTQAGNLQIGAYNSTNFFDGEISDVRLWSSVRSAAQIRDNMGKTLVGNEANLVGYWKLNGNFNDSTSNANHLTPSGGVLATALDAPLVATEFGIITGVTYAAGNTTIMVFTGNVHNAPAENLTGVAYSSARAPYGFPASRSKWRLRGIIRQNQTQTSPGASTWYNLGGMLSLPAGEWDLGFTSPLSGARASGGATGTYYIGLSTTNNNVTATEKIIAGVTRMDGATAGGNNLRTMVTRMDSVELATQTPYYLNALADGGNTELTLHGAEANIIISAECAYV